jgi:hypothetical protein
MRALVARRGSGESRRSNQERVEKNKMRGVPYPGYFAKCAEAIDFKRVGRNSCLKVWRKCAKGIGSKGVRRKTGSRAGGVPQIHSGCKGGSSARMSFSIHGGG